MERLGFTTRQAQKNKCMAACAATPRRPALIYDTRFDKKKQGNAANLLRRVRGAQVWECSRGLLLQGRHACCRRTQNSLGAWGLGCNLVLRRLLHEVLWVLALEGV